MRPFCICCSNLSDKDMFDVFNILVEIGDVGIVPSCLDHTSGYPHRDFTWFGLSKDTGATAFEMRASELMGDELTMDDLKDIAVSWLVKEERVLVNGEWISKKVLDALPVHPFYTPIDGYYLIIENGFKDVVRIHDRYVYKIGSSLSIPLLNFLENNPTILKRINIESSNAASLPKEDDIPF